MPLAEFVATVAKMQQSLRTRTRMVAAVLAGFALVTVAALIFATLQMERINTQLARDMLHVRQTGELWSALLYHDAVTRQFELSGDAHAAAEMARMTRQIRGQLDQARARAHDRGDAHLVAELERNVEERFARSTTSPPMARERELVIALMDRTLARARSTAEVMQRQGRMARWVGLLVLVALAVVLAITLRLQRRHVTRPLELLRDSVRSYRPGGGAPRAEEQGVSEIREISRAFNETAAQAEHQREVALTFISAVAHDLRNPLHALRLSASTIRPGHPLPSEEKLRERFALIVQQSDRLNRLVEDLLDTSRIEAGQLSLDLGEHDLVELVREAVALHEDVSDRHHLVTRFPDREVRVHADAARVGQVLNNLLSNAIKYSPGGGEVIVEVKEAGGWASISVTDRGIGIPPAEREAIFEPFRRSTSTRAKIPGVGLGLSVARRIVEAHGGSLELDSEVGRGSTFRVTLPAHAADDRDARPRESSLQG